MNIKSLCVTINFAKKQVKPCNESEMKYGNILQLEI